MDEFDENGDDRAELVDNSRDSESVVILQVRCATLLFKYMMSSHHYRGGM